MWLHVEDKTENRLRRNQLEAAFIGQLGSGFIVKLRAPALGPGIVYNGVDPSLGVFGQRVGTNDAKLQLELIESGFVFFQESNRRIEEARIGAFRNRRVGQIRVFRRVYVLAERVTRAHFPGLRKERQEPRRIYGPVGLKRTRRVGKLHT